MSLVPRSRLAPSLLSILSALLVVALFVLPMPSADAQPPRSGAMDEAASAEAERPEPKVEEQTATTTHRVTVDSGETLSYTATAGTLVLADEEGDQKASVFYIAYVRDGVDEGARRPVRPVTFSFNGGPGSSSVWLHLGLLGPRVVAMDEEGMAPPLPYELVANPHTLLDVSDLVFIDPVSTGFSRPTPGEEPGQFHGLDEDVESVGAFIRRWVARQGRWDSPKYLIGESYGTTRAAALVDHLQSRHGMYFNGVMLVSSILDFQTARFEIGNDLPYPLFLPTYAATARYHGRLGPEASERPIEEFLDEVEAFAAGEYQSALFLGDRLPAAERRRIAERLARYTGLSVEYLEDTDLRPVIFRFTKELLRDEGETVGRLDSRFIGHDRLDVGDGYEYDPSYAAIQGPYTATLNDYVRDELGFEAEIDYEILGGRIRDWNFERWENRYVNVAEDLRSAMTRNPDLDVHVANGYYDLATPYFATEYTFDHLGLPEHLQGNVSMSWYEAGHMMYIRAADLEALGERLERFVEETDGLE